MTDAATLATYADEAACRAFAAKEDANDAARAARIYDCVADLDLRGARVLDAGCGFGRDVAAFAAMGADARGVDASPAMVAEAGRRHPAMAHRFRVGRIDADEGLGRGAYDLVWCCASLLHVPRARLATAARNLAAATRPGGRVVVMTKEGRHERLDVALGPGRPRTMVYYLPDEVAAALATHGCEPDGPVSCGFVAKSGDAFFTMRARRSRTAGIAAR